MSITDSTTADAGSRSVTSFGSIDRQPSPLPFTKKPYVRPTVHIDVLPGPVLCASQGGGGGTGPTNPDCPPWKPNC